MTVVLIIRLYDNTVVGAYWRKEMAQEYMEYLAFNTTHTYELIDIEVQ